MFESDNPGQVKCQVKASSKIVTFNLLQSKENLPRSSEMPGVLSGIGLDAARLDNGTCLSTFVNSVILTVPKILYARSQLCLRMRLT